MRIPISPVRRATVYDVVPYNPTHAIASDSIAKAVQRRANSVSGTISLIPWSCPAKVESGMEWLICYFAFVALSAGD
jgi:hypothetical protein